MKKILILHTSVGLGHKYIALNIAYHLQHGGFEVKTADVLQVQKSKLGEFGNSLYLGIIQKVPFIWDYLYQSKLINTLLKPLRVPLASKNAFKILDLVRDFDPDLIITTQTTASALIASLKKSGEFKGKFVITFSDYHFHSFWYYPEADFYFANIQEQVSELLKLGIKEQNIAITGVPLKPKAISRTDEQLSEFKANLGIPIDAKVALVGTGSMGIGLDISGLKSLVFSMPEVFWLVLAGKNQQLVSALEFEFKGTNNIGILGFQDNMPSIYQIADIFITKPGGISIAESIQYELPAFITHKLPGQEQLNIDYLVKHKLIKAFNGFGDASLSVEIASELKTKSLKNYLSTSEARYFIEDNISQSPINKAISKMVDYTNQ